MEIRSSRSQILIRGDNSSPNSSTALDSDIYNAFPRQLSNLFSDNVYLSDPWHDDIFLNQPDDDISKSTWRLKDRMKTTGVALVLCLNLGTDPPDVVKPAHCARRECWFDPTGPKQKGLELIGNALQQQYERWQSKAKYKQCLDPTSEDLRRLCINLRKAAKNDRLLFHYNGHGVPRPTKNGELWVFGKHYTHYMPVAIVELRSWLGDPAIYVLDCSGAGALLPHFMDLNAAEKEKEKERDNLKGSSASFSQFMSGKTPGGGGGGGGGSNTPDLNGSADYVTRSQSQSTPFSPTGFQAGVDSQTIVLAACRANEILPLSPHYPADLFTCCLTTPIPIALRWFILQNPHSMGDISVDLSENIPGDHSDRKTPRGELHWIFTAVTDTIAWNTLPSNVFQKLFREDLLAASLFRNFLLAKRLMKSLNCTAQSWPPLPDSSTHPLWQTWDLAAESCLFHISSLQRGAPMIDPQNNRSPIASNSTFFTEHLTAFEIWLDFGERGSEAPMHLPILLQVLLSQTHRLRALQLLKRYLSLGSYAVNLSLVVGIFPYVLKLLQSPAGEVRQLLVSIWASILGFDPSCRQELVRDKMQGYFIQYLQAKDRDMPAAQRCMAAFVLAEICNGYKDGQHSCLLQGLHRTCTGILKSFLENTSPVHVAAPAGFGTGGSSSRAPSATAFSAEQSDSNANCKVWISLCLYKLVEQFAYAKYLVFTEAGHSQLYPLLQDSDVTVRASSVLALGELFGASSLAPTLADSQSAKPLSAQGSTAPQHKGPLTPGLFSPPSNSGGVLPASGSQSPSPFGVTASALSKGQNWGSRSTPDSNHTPSQSVFGANPGAFGAQNMHLENPSNQAVSPGSSSSYTVFEGRKVTVLSAEQMELLEAELLLATQLLESCTDGSVLVRREAVIALSKFVILPHHVSCIRLVASGLFLEARGAIKPTSEKRSVPHSLSSSLSSSQAAGRSAGSLEKELEASFPSSSGAGSSGGRPLPSSASTPVISSVKAAEESAQGRNIPLSDPWQLSLSQSQSIVDRLALFLNRVGYPSVGDGGSSPGPSVLGILPTTPNGHKGATEMKQPVPKLPSQVPNFGINNDGPRDMRTVPPPLSLDPPGMSTAEEKSEDTTESDTDLCKSVTMARAYVRLWLALNEVKGRDPHPVVANAAAVVIRRITVHLDRDIDRTQRSAMLHTRRPDSIGSYDRVVSPVPSPRFSSTPNREGSSGLNQNVLSPPFGLNRGKSPSFTNVYSVASGGSGEEIGSNPWDKGGPILPPAAPSIDVGRRRITGAMNAPSPTSRSGSRATASTPSSLRGPSPVPNPSFGVPRTELGANGQGIGQGQGIMQGNYFGGNGRSNGIISASSLAGISNTGSYGVNGLRDQGQGEKGDPGSDPLDDEEELLEYEQEPALVSCLYNWSRKLFLNPAPGYDPYSDPLSIEGCSRLYRDSKLNEILRHEHRLSEIFKYVDDKEDLLQLDRKTKEDLQSAKTTMVAALPSSVTKFEQKAVLNIETAEVTTLVMFHSFHDILAVSDGYGVGIWSLTDGTRIMQIPNTGGARQNNSQGPSSAYRENYRRHLSSLGERERGSSNAGDRVGPDVVSGGRLPQGLGGVSPGLGSGLNVTTGPLIDGSAGQALGTAGIAAAVAGRTRTGSFSLIPAVIAPVSSLEGVARVTAMLWINESYESLLLMGSDDGSVKVWKDSADTEVISAHNNSPQPSSSHSDKDRDLDRSVSSNNMRDMKPPPHSPVVTANAPSSSSIYGGFYNSSESGSTGASLASAFVALPDVAQDARGSGMVLSWIQPTGTLVAGGNSSTIRVWDVGREQCVRVFDTGLGTCTTAIASRTVGMDFAAASHVSPFYGASPNYSPSPFRNQGDGSMNLVSWTFAGSADGTVSVFDERVPSTAAHGGRVHCSRDHTAWIVSAHLRADGVPEVITGSVRGAVKFWDLRSMRTFKSFEVHKSPLTALAVHSCAPIIATGSHAQFIKILTLGNDQLGSIIKYHDGFLGQRIGPVSCLAFHPTRMRLAAGATDSIVSIYTTASDM